MTVGGSDARWATSDLINERLDFKFLRDPFGLTQSVIAITVESYAPIHGAPGREIRTPRKMCGLRLWRMGMYAHRL